MGRTAGLHGGNHDGENHDGCDRGCQCGAGRGRVAEVPARAGHGAVLQRVEHVPLRERDAHDDQERTAWIARRNGDGSVRVVLRQGSRFTATSAIDTFKSLFKKQVKPPMEYHFGYFDLFPDGRLGPDAELGYRITPASLFPRLPDDDAKAKTGWSQRDEERKSYQEPMSKLKGHRPDKIVVHLSAQTGRGKPSTCPPTMTSTRPCGPECDRAGTNGEPPRPCRHVPSTSIMSVLEHR